MNRRVLVYGVGFLVLALILLPTAVEKYGPEQATIQSRSSEPTVAGHTRAEYLEKVSNGGQDQLSLCSYTYLIDNFGLEETYRMDARAMVDENDIDERIYDALESCL